MTSQRQELAFLAFAAPPPPPPSDPSHVAGLVHEAEERVRRPCKQIVLSAESSCEQLRRELASQVQANSKLRENCAKLERQASDLQLRVGSSHPDEEALRATPSAQLRERDVVHAAELARVQTELNACNLLLTQVKADANANFEAECARAQNKIQVLSAKLGKSTVAFEAAQQQAVSLNQRIRN